MPSESTSASVSFVLRTLQMLVSIGLLALAIWFMTSELDTYPNILLIVASAMTMLYTFMAFIAGTPAGVLIGRPALVEVLEFVHFALWTATAVTLGVNYGKCRFYARTHLDSPFNGDWIRVITPTCRGEWAAIGLASAGALFFLVTFLLHSYYTWAPATALRGPGVSLMKPAPYILGQIFVPLRDYSDHEKMREHTHETFTAGHSGAVNDPAVPLPEGATVVDAPYAGEPPYPLSDESPIKPTDSLSLSPSVTDYDGAGVTAHPPVLREVVRKRPRDENPGYPKRKTRWAKD